MKSGKTVNSKKNGGTEEFGKIMKSKEMRHSKIWPHIRSHINAHTRSHVKVHIWRHIHAHTTTRMYENMENNQKKAVKIIEKTNQYQTEPIRIM